MNFFKVSFCFLDHLLRRWILPLTLLGASLIRYNLLSFSYLLFFIVGVVIPSPRLKKQRVSCIIYNTILVACSLLYVLGQVGFQGSLATGFTLESCETLEIILRQAGFILYNVPALDVARHLVPDIIVLVVSAVTLGISTTVGFSHAKEATPTETTHLATRPHPLVQSYFKLPSWMLYCMDIGIFVMFLFSGVIVPSITSFVYFGVFLCLALSWSFHLKLTRFVRCTRIGGMFYVSCHLLCLYLYQFQSLQSTLSVEPTNTRNSLIARLLGFTPVIETDCTRSTQLLIWSDTPTNYYIYPWALIGLLWILGTDFQFWLTTPHSLWNKECTYHIPLLIDESDSPPSSGRGSVTNEESVAGVGHYGATLTTPTSPIVVETSLSTMYNNEPPSSISSSPSKRKKYSLKTLWKKFTDRVNELAIIIMNINYIFSLVAMMLWSVFYPSWLALVLLLWACAIWLIPRISPKRSFYLTSPLLLLYAVVLLLMQYIHSLNLTPSELTWDVAIGTECGHTLGSKLQECRSGVIAVKSLLTLTFCASVHELIKELKAAGREEGHGSSGHDNTQGDSPLLGVVEEESTDYSQREEKELSTIALLNIKLQIILRTYWILVVVGGFLLVILAGDASLLKSVYVVFFFLFILLYQIFPKWWLRLNFPFWCIIVAYASLHLILVYTFPFPEINQLWMTAYNKSSLNITSNELFDAIGFLNYTPTTNSSKSLFLVLFPLVVFIAALILQIRYFTSCTFPCGRRQGAEQEVEPTLSFGWFANRVAQAISRREAPELSAIEETREREGEVNNEEEESDETGSTSQYGDGTDIGPKLPNKITIYKSIVFVLVWTRKIVIEGWHLFWRFCEIHLLKIIMLCLFILSLYEVSLSYSILALFVIIVTPLPMAVSKGGLVLVTGYLGVVTLAKFVFQIDLIKSFMFNGECEEYDVSVLISSVSFKYKFSPIHNDSSWFGLNKAPSQTEYIAGPLLVSLLITLWYAAKRHQYHYYETNDIVIDSWDVNSLFIGVKENHAHFYWTETIKYLINHFFEMYGLEVCWVVQAVLVAVRIDIYGVLGAIILGVMLLCPRAHIRIPWILLLVVQGGLIVVQYGALLGGPPSVLCDNDYYWDRSFANHSYGIKLQKWLYLPHRGSDILNKYWLIVYIVSYICMARHLRYLVRNPLDSLRKLNPSQYPIMLDMTYFLDYIKILVFSYFFWFALFMIFVAGAFGLDLFGFIYLLSCFVYLYRGKDLLTDRMRIRRRWWVALRNLTFVILLIRIITELLGCVFITQLDIKSRCLLIGLFDLRCTQAKYYGIPSNIECENGTQSSTGLWFDVIGFSVLILQRILSDSPYADQVEQDITEREANSVNFASIMKEVLENGKRETEEQMIQDLKELEERAAKLKATIKEPEGQVAHLLHAGTRIPPQYVSTYINPLELPDSEDHIFLEATPTSKDPREREEDPSEAQEEEGEKTEISKLVRLGRFLLSTWLSIVDYTIDWLNSTSSNYIEVLKRLKREREGTVRDVSEDPNYFQDIEVIKSKTVTSEVTPIAMESTPTQSTPRTSESDERAIPTQKTTPKEGATPTQGATPFTESVLSEPKSPKDKLKRRGHESTKSIVFGDASTNFDQSGDVILETLKIHPSRSEEQQAREVSSRLEELSTKYSKRPKRLLSALYYWVLSHFEFVIFFFMIMVILLTGSLISFVYAGILFLWGLLYVPWPSKRFWLTLLFLTMFVLMLKYVYYFVYVTVLASTSTQSNEVIFLGAQTDPFSWVFGIQIESSYFSNSVVHLLLLMTIIFHRGLMKQHGLWHSTSSVTAGTNILKSTLQGAFHFFKNLLSSQVVAGQKDYYIWILTFDVLCFVTIVLGYSQFTVNTSANNSNTPATDVANVGQVASFIQSNNVPLPFVLMLFLQFLSMLIDRAIYLRHSIRAKFVFYVIMLLGWHVWLLIALPIITERAFIHNSAAQTIYFFKSLYFIMSALQMISGYPLRLLGYFVGKNYSTVAGIIFMGYRLIPILPELRDVMDWVFTDTSLSLFNWLRVQEIWATLYQIKVRREREKTFPRDLGDQQSFIIKLLMGGAMLAALVLLIWGPLLVVSLVNTTGTPNPPIFASLQIHLEGYQLLDIQAQSSFIHDLTPAQFDTIRTHINSTSIQREFNTLFDRRNFKRIVFPGNSSLLWTASEPSQEQLKRQLSRNMTHKIDCTWTLRRSPGTSGVATEVISGSRQTNIGPDVTQQFIDNLNGNLTLIELNDLYPVFISAPANDMSTIYTALANNIQTGRYVNCSAQLNRTQTDTNITINQWWTLIQTSNYTVFTGEENGALEMIVYSEPVVSAIFSYIFNLGIIGLYVSVVLVIGKFVRSYVNSLALDITVDQIPYPDRLLELCDDIFNVREAKNFVLEEVLVGRLIYIFRSPQRLLEITELPKLKSD